jgi:hypothetical protein
MILAFQLKSKKIEMTFLLTAEYSDSNTTIQMNPRQAREYKHSQKLKAEEMKAKAKEQEKEGLSVKICDAVEEAIEDEKEKAEWIYGKDVKGKMTVDIKLNEGHLTIKAIFTPEEGVRPLEGRREFGIIRTKKW